MFIKIKELYKKYREQVCYMLVGGLTTLVSLSSYYLCVRTVLDPRTNFQLQLANVISWFCAVAFAFFANREYVFNSSNSILPEAVKFVGSRVSTLIIDMATMALLVSVMGMNDKIAKIIVQFIVFILNYIFSKLIVFRRK